MVLAYLRGIQGGLAENLADGRAPIANAGKGIAMAYGIKGIQGDGVAVFARTATDAFLTIGLSLTSEADANRGVDLFSD